MNRFATPNPREIGQRAENLARDFLISRGLELVATNYRCRRGEIDLVMRNEETLVFVEVRFRRRSNYGSGAESIDGRKQAKLIATAQHYLKEHARSLDNPCRFDVVSISMDHGHDEVEWIQNAFQA